MQGNMLGVTPEAGDTLIASFARPAPAADAVQLLVSEMTLEEKAAQMTQAELGSVTPDDLARTGLGSVLSGGGGNPGDGSATAWRDAVDAFVEGSRRSRLGIPILYGVDAVHGHNNVLGATIFPHQIGLGATADAALVRAVARAAALETLATGVRWSFAPCLAVPQDVRWGRTYAGVSQDGGLAGQLGRAAVEGWHGDDLRRSGVLACPKHFVGEGAMVWGTAGGEHHPWIDWWDGWGAAWQIDQGDVRLSEDELRRDHLAPFVEAIDAGALTIMAGYASWHGERGHGNRYLLTDLLKRELGFEGFVVSDWMAIDQLDEDYGVAAATAINAGVDMVMVPFDYERFIGAVVDQVSAGNIPLDRIDDAVARVLLAKHRIGLLDAEGADRAPDVSIDVVGCAQHRALARRAAAAGTVVLADRGALPIAPDADVLAAGAAIDDIGLACGGWTISWAGSAGAITTGRTVLDGLRDALGSDRVRLDAHGDADGATARVGVVTVHEPPYVEGGGDRADLAIPHDQLEVVRSVRDRVEQLVVVVISGRPLIVEPLLDIADAVVAAWLPGSEADGVADVLVGRSPATGTLPVAWPRSQAQVDGRPDSAPPPWPIGHGVPLGSAVAPSRSGGG